MYFDHIHPHPQTPPRSTYLSLLVQMCFIFLVCKPIRSSLCFPYVLGYVTSHWRGTDLQKNILLKKTDSPYPNSCELSTGLGLRSHLPSPCHYSIWLQLAQFCACSHSHCEFICAASLLGPEDTIPCSHPLALAFTFFLFLF